MRTRWLDGEMARVLGEVARWRDGEMTRVLGEMGRIGGETKRNVFNLIFLKSTGSFSASLTKETKVQMWKDVGTKMMAQGFRRDGPACMKKWGYLKSERKEKLSKFLSETKKTGK